ncbi:hypothetical protein ACVWZP_004120 [Pseudomonas sp. TE36184]
MKIFTPLPGEYIASALKRGNELLGVASLATEDFYIKPVPRAGYGKSGSLLPVTVEEREHAVFDFPKFLTENNIAEDVLTKHTLYPINAALGRSRACSKVTPKVWARICPECAVEDLETYGSTYIHTRHVQAYVKVCNVHGSKLLEACPHCSIPISRHAVAKLGYCNQKYKTSKRSRRQLNSPPHQYASFIAELLNYRGPMVNRYLADFIAHISIFKHYAKDLERPHNKLDMTYIIEHELGLSVKYSRSDSPLDNKFSIYAFIGCRTADKYFELLSNKELRDSLRDTIHYSNLLHWRLH